MSTRFEGRMGKCRYIGLLRCRSMAATNTVQTAFPCSSECDDQVKDKEQRKDDERLVSVVQA